MEIWKKTKYGNYYASNKGRIKRIYKNGKEKILKGVPDKDSYYKITLSINGKRINKSIHKLIAETFIDNPNNYKVINHKDENKQNNCVDNLEWCTIQYNNNYNNRMYRINGLKKKKIVQYKNNKIIGMYNSVQEASKITGILRTSISKVLTKKGTIHGYTFKYKLD